MPAFLPSELPVRRRTRHHWIVLFRLPHKLFSIALVLLLLAAAFDPWPMVIPFLIVFGVFVFLRWQIWQAEWLILTGKRIIRVQGVPETTSTEASLRIDRVSGARIVQTVPGKLLGYGTIELEAPGDHPDVRKLVKINNPVPFYLAIRQVMFSEETRPGDPDDGLLDPYDDPRDYITEPLPVVSRVRDRFGRRRE